MTASKSWATAMLAVLSTLAPVGAQDTEVVTVEVDLVTVNVSVTDGGKRPVPNLQAMDFSVTDEGRPVALEFFDSQGPASIVFVIDTSESMKHEKWKKLRDGLKKFLARARVGNDYTLIAFSDEARLVARSVSAEELWRSFNELEPSGHTALYDAVLLGLEALGQAPRRHKALVLLSDGEDNRSRAQLPDVQREALARRATVYAVGLLMRRQIYVKYVQKGKEVLNQLAEATGGVASFPNLDEIRGVLEGINTDVSNQYTLGYYAPDATPGWRNIQVGVTPEQRRFRLRYQQRYLKR